MDRACAPQAPPGSGPSPDCLLSPHAHTCVHTHTCSQVHSFSHSCSFLHVLKHARSQACSCTHSHTLVLMHTRSQIHLFILLRTYSLVHSFLHCAHNLHAHFLTHKFPPLSVLLPLWSGLFLSLPPLCSRT